MLYFHLFTLGMPVHWSGNKHSRY